MKYPAIAPTCASDLPRPFDPVWHKNVSPLNKHKHICNLLSI